MDRSSARLTTLDGLRGMAAILAMLFHGGPTSPIAMPRGYLAVDMFFVLSGFVIAQNYEPRLASGMTLRQFVRQRLIRVYPMFFVGTLVGLLLWGARPFAFLMIPDPGNPVLFPSNGPMWSLLFELIVNVLFALFALRLGPRGLGAILAVSGVLLWFAAKAPHGLDAGAFWHNAPAGMVRTVYSFTAGVAAFRLHRHLRIERRETPLAWALLPLLIVLFWPDYENRALADALVALFVLPAIVWLGAMWQAPGARAMEALGAMSFPLYCIHLPIIYVVIARTGPQAQVLYLAMPVMALALDRYVDRPVRRVLSRLGRATAPALTPA
ncbi:MAG: acyltransferase [Sphingomonadales bacterium]|nr:acyltransferase [Sphingomonadales bacterium]